MDQINNKPESPLPWTRKLGSILDSNRIPVSRQAEAYVVHACNAYPKLIEFLQKQELSLYANWETEPISHQYLELLSELGEDARPNN